MPVAFDTYALITKLQRGHMPLEQAEAVSEALKEALEETIGDLATKKDLETLRGDLTTQLRHVKWMIGIHGTLTLLILGKLLLFKP